MDGGFQSQGDSFNSALAENEDRTIPDPVPVCSYIRKQMGLLKMVHQVNVREMFPGWLSYRQSSFYHKLIGLLEKLCWGWVV